MYYKLYKMIYNDIGSYTMTMQYRRLIPNAPLCDRTDGQSRQWMQDRACKKF